MESTIVTTEAIKKTERIITNVRGTMRARFRQKYVMGDNGRAIALCLSVISLHPLYPSAETCQEVAAA